MYIALQKPSETPERDYKHKQGHKKGGKGPERNRRPIIIPYLTIHALAVMLLGTISAKIIIHCKFPA